LTSLEKLPGVKVVKGDGETYILENGQRQTVEWFKVARMVDPIGAGDGFGAGFLAGVLRGYTHEEAVRLGNFVGSLVVQGPGDWESLPKASYVDAILQGQKHIER
jgi:2-dehydro-3-deoxygluconokinase